MRAPFPDMEVEAINELYLPPKVPDGPLSAEKLVCNDKGQPFANLANVKTVLRQHPQWAGVVAVDRMQGRTMLLRPIPGMHELASDPIFPRPITDVDVINTTEWFQREGEQKNRP